MTHATPITIASCLFPIPPVPNPCGDATASTICSSSLDTTSRPCPPVPEAPYFCTLRPRISLQLPAVLLSKRTSCWVWYHSWVRRAPSRSEHEATQLGG